MLRVVIGAYGVTIAGMAWLAGACLFLVFVAIVLDVSIRTAGGHPPEWTSTFVEYAMLLVCMLAGPWVTKSNAHIAISSLTSTAPATLRHHIERLSLITCLLGSLIVSAFATALAAEAWDSGQRDIRSVEVPGWMLFSFMAGGFGFVAVEFGRLLLLSLRRREGGSLAASWWRTEHDS